MAPRQHFGPRRSHGPGAFRIGGLGRHGVRCPLKPERLPRDETPGQVVYRARSGHQDIRGELVALWDLLGLLARSAATHSRGDPSGPESPPGTREARRT